MAELLDLAVAKLKEKLAEDITVIDMASVNPFTDYFVIATARNVRHAASLADDVIEEAEQEEALTEIPEAKEEPAAETAVHPAAEATNLLKNLLQKQEQLVSLFPH